MNRLTSLYRHFHPTPLLSLSENSIQRRETDPFFTFPFHKVLPQKNFPVANASSFLLSLIDPALYEAAMWMQEKYLPKQLLYIKIFLVFLSTCVDPQERSDKLEKIILQPNKERQQTLLHVLASRGDAKTAQTILSMLPDEKKRKFLEIRNGNDETPLLTAASHAKNNISNVRDVIRVFLQEGADSNNIVPILCNSLTKEQELNQVLAFVPLEQRKRMINESDIFYSLRYHSPSIVRWLIKNGADLCQIKENGDTVVHTAIESNDLETLQLVLENLPLTKREDFINAQNLSGHTPLFLAQKKTLPKIYKILFEHAVFLVKNIGGENSLHLIAQCNDSQILQAALTQISQKEKNEWVNQKNQNGETPLLLACKYCTDSKCVEILIENGANFLETDSFGNTIFHIVIAENNAKVLETLSRILSTDQIQTFMHGKNGEGKKPIYLLNTLKNPDNIKEMIPLLLPFCKNFQTLQKVMNLATQGKTDLLRSFGIFIENKILLYSDSPKIDEQVCSLLQIFDTFTPSFTLTTYLCKNPKLTLHPPHLHKILLTYQKFQKTKYENAIEIIIQTSDNIDVFTYVVEGLFLPDVYEIKTFLSLSHTKQLALMSRYCTFRDRKATVLANFIIKEAGQNRKRFSSDLLLLVLQFIEKTYILSNPKEGENSIIALIWALLERQETHPKVIKLLSQAITTLVQIDLYCLNTHYRAGIFLIFQFAKEHRIEPLLLSAIQGLGKYSYDPAKEEDKEIYESMTELAQKNDLSLSLQKELGLVLSTICEEKSLLTALLLVQGNAWDQYENWEKSHEKIYEGSSHLFSYYSPALHENRGIMQKTILDLLGEFHKQSYQSQVDLIYEDFRKQPHLYPQLQQYEKKISNLPDGFRFMDPLYLPKDSCIFRGIKGQYAPNKAVLDLIMKGVGSSELSFSTLIGEPGATTSQFFFSLDTKYMAEFANIEGAIIVLDGNYVNQMILRRLVRQESEVGSKHYVFYNPISLQHIKAIYVSKQILEEIQILRHSNINNVPPLTQFSKLSKEELAHFIQAIQHDPYGICDRIKEGIPVQVTRFVPHNESDYLPFSDNDLKKMIPNEKQTPFTSVRKENVKREIFRMLMKEKYAQFFADFKM